MTSTDQKIRLSSEIEVSLIRAMASDDYVVQAARVSTARDTLSWESSRERTAGLINRLMADRHGTPFEHGGIFTFRIHAPIFVFREWQRHRIGWSYNEQSGRYTVFEPEFYVPPADRPLVQTGKPMDYRFEPGTETQHYGTRAAHEAAMSAAWGAYELMINNGIAREIARNVLPVSVYSTMYATCNPRSLMSFLALRTSDVFAAYPSHPQWEIEKAARKIEEEFKREMPETLRAFNANGRVAP